jgi:hypothetical protein
MKSLAEFKRALTVGTMVGTIYHREFAGRNPETMEVIYKDKDLGARPVSKVMASQVAFKTERGTDSFLNWPKASECEFNGNSVTVYEEDRGKRYKVLTYTIL